MVSKDIPIRVACSGRLSLMFAACLLCVWLSAARISADDEAKRRDPELRPPLTRITFVDAKTEKRTIDARVLLEAQDGGLLLEGRDGRLWNVSPKQLQNREALNQTFRPLSSEDLGQQLRRELSELGVKSFTEVVITKHYVICSTAGRQYAEWCGEAFERLHDAFRQFWKEANLELPESEFPLPAIVLKDRAEFAAFAAKHDRPDAAESPGYFSEPTNRIVLFDLTAGAKSSAPRSVAELKRRLAASALNVATTIHEATHQIAFNCGLHTRYADNPRWLTEGLAMFFEVPDLESRIGWSSIGRVNVTRLRDYRATLRSTPKRALSLADLIRADDSFLREETLRAAYAKSWALTFFLLKTRPAETVSFLKTIRSKPRLIPDSPEQRLAEFEAAFGNVEELEREWIQWMAKQ
jgi:hypothetical protein